MIGRPDSEIIIGNTKIFLENIHAVSFGCNQVAGIKNRYLPTFEKNGLPFPTVLQ
jgi:hypothetical protein